MHNSMNEFITTGNTMQGSGLQPVEPKRKWKGQRSKFQTGEIMTNISMQAVTTQSGLCLIAQSKQKTASGAREVPSQVMPAMRKMIVGSFYAGRSIKQLATEYKVTQACALELVIRSFVEHHQERRAANLEDALRMPAQAHKFQRAA